MLRINLTYYNSSYPITGYPFHYFSLSSLLPSLILEDIKCYPTTCTACGWVSQARITFTSLRTSNTPRSSALPRLISVPLVAWSSGTTSPSLLTSRIILTFGQIDTARMASVCATLDLTRRATIVSGINSSSVSFHPLSTPPPHSPHNTLVLILNHREPHHRSEERRRGYIGYLLRTHLHRWCLWLVLGVAEQEESLSKGPRFVNLQIFPCYECLAKSKQLGTCERKIMSIVGRLYIIINLFQQNFSC